MEWSGPATAVETITKNVIATTKISLPYMWLKGHLATVCHSGRQMLTPQMSSIGRGRKGRGNMKWVDTAEEEEKETQATILAVGGQQIPPLKVSLKLKERWTQGLQYH